MRPARLPKAGHAWLDGAIDLHVHCAPSFTRWGDGLDLARACEQAGMAGVVLKAHEGSTVAAAAILDRISSSLRVLGGVVLNRYVGGINPAAAEAALRLGGRCIWFPTMDANAHARAFGSTGAYPSQRGGIESPTGIRLLDTEGKLVDAAREVLAIAAENDALVATGHLDGARSPLSSPPRDSQGCGASSSSIRSSQCPALSRRRSSRSSSREPSSS
jgi:hypothetical protein